tara:strand:- start:212 stop:370 length:159 start_codon:yes stop_codon:yes gene_type:complete
MNDVSNKILQFCLIQLQILKDKETKTRKELLDYKIQKEFLNSMIEDLRENSD